MTVRICSHRLSMQSDVLNDQQTLSNEIDCSSTLQTTLIYSGLKLHPKPLVPTISMPSMANPLSVVKKLSVSDAHLENSTKNLSSSLRHPTTTTTPSSIRLVTSSAGFSSSKTYILNPQQNSSSPNSSSLVTLIPPGTSSSKLQTLISSTNDLSHSNDLHQNSKTTSFLSKNRLTLVQPLITNPNSSTNSTTTTTTNSLTPKLMIQPNATSSIWSSQSTTKILSAKMLSHPVQLISPLEHSPTTNENPIFTAKTLDTGHQAFIHMSLLPSSSSSPSSQTSNESINPIQLTNFYSTPSVRLTTSRSMDHNNNHSINPPILREMSIEEKSTDNNFIKIQQTKSNTLKNRTRFPLQQISSVLSSTKKHKLSEDEQNSSSTSRKKFRSSRQHSSTKPSTENTTPSNCSTTKTSFQTDEIIPTKKRSSAELAAAAILSSSHLRKKRIQRKTSEETLQINSNIQTINDELLKRLSQDFVYDDHRTGLRWIARKTRSQPMNSLLSKYSWKPKINHYEKYSDVIRLSSKRTVPMKSPETIRQKLLQPSSSWRIDRITNYLTDLTHDEQTTQKSLIDVGELFNQLNLDDCSLSKTIENLIEDNVQRHRSFSEQLNQISNLLNHLLEHGKTLREIQLGTKINGSTNCLPNRRTKDR